MDKLYIIIPAYNEADTIAQVVQEWHTVVSRLNPQSRLVIIDDGSKDNTVQILNNLQKNYPQLIILTKPNSGHGATLLYGYNYALAHNADFIFQTDSDGQTIADEFWPFWTQRQSFSAIIGQRKQRQDGWSRILVTKVLKFILLIIFRVNIPDANTPFRLISGITLAKYLGRIPEDFNLTNIILTVYLVKNKEKVKFLPITFKPRQGGINSINLRKIIKIGGKALKDFWQIKKQI
ncbi:MAG: glycosyltransferase family 2 protein [Verrucomicrobiota bacterium]|nr:glycosyltransferase family 2 protein [Verrucomicrobiota bacterium]